LRVIKIGAASMELTCHDVEIMVTTKSDIL